MQTQESGTLTLAIRFIIAHLFAATRPIITVPAAKTAIMVIHMIFYPQAVATGRAEIIDKYQNFTYNINNFVSVTIKEEIKNV